MVLFITLGIVVGAIAIYLVLISFVLDLSVPSQPLGRSAMAAALEPPVPKQEVRFEVGGTALSAWLFTPDGASGPSPCVVMGHGFGGTKDCGLEDYARRYRDAGFVVLAFDYRYFGESAGEPRQLYWIADQLEDWAAAVRYARSLPEVDAGRIALWGSSASGGHVIVTAAEDEKIACVVAQCPSLDPRMDGDRIRRQLGIAHVLRLIVHAQRDMLRSRFGLSAHRIPIVGPPGSMCMLASPGAYAGFARIVPGGFVNEVCARSVLRIASYRPIEYAKDVRCPVLIQLCEKDELASPQAAEDTAAILGERAELVRYPLGHFEIYQGAAFETAVRDQIAFFHKHV